MPVALLVVYPPWALIDPPHAIMHLVSREADVNQLVHTLTTDFPELNIIINNAGRGILYDKLFLAALYSDPVMPAFIRK